MQVWVVKTAFIWKLKIKLGNKDEPMNSNIDRALPPFCDSYVSSDQLHVSLSTIPPPVFGKWNPWSLSSASPKAVELSSLFGLRTSS